MCIIIIKPAGVKMPSDNLLRAAARYNRDGCGFMTANGTTFRCLYEDLETFLTRLRACRDDETVAMHFRYATHGSVCVKNCHPFRAGDLMLMHNGVIDFYQNDCDITDSQAFLMDNYAKLVRFGVQSANTAKIFGRYKSSKFVLMNTKSGEIKTFGDFTSFGGCLFSNLRPFADGLTISDGRVDYPHNNHLFCFM